MGGAATAGEAAVGVGGGAGVGCEGGEGDAFEPPGGPRGASFGSFGGYLSRTGDASRPTNPFEGRAFGRSGLRGAAPLFFFAAMGPVVEALRPITWRSRPRKPSGASEVLTGGLEPPERPGYTEFVAMRTVRIPVTDWGFCRLTHYNSIK
jgi:hypothetical protein